MTRSLYLRIFIILAAFHPARLAVAAPPIAETLTQSSQPSVESVPLPADTPPVDAKRQTDLLFEFVWAIDSLCLQEVKSIDATLAQCLQGGNYYLIAKATEDITARVGRVFDDVMALSHPSLVSDPTLAQAMTDARERVCIALTSTSLLSAFVAKTFRETNPREAPTDLSMRQAEDLNVSAANRWKDARGRLQDLLSRWEDREKARIDSAGAQHSVDRIARTREVTSFFDSIMLAGGEVAEPKLLSRDAVTYPYAARVARVQGDVVLEAVVEKSGSLAGFQVRKSPNEVLTFAALRGIQQRRYQPASLRGIPVRTSVTVTVTFDSKQEHPTIR